MPLKGKWNIFLDFSRKDEKFTIYATQQQQLFETDEEQSQGSVIYKLKMVTPLFYCLLPL
jgi:hypothetical protein